MKRTNGIGRIACVALGLLIQAGCGGRHDANVEGRVLLDGAPLPANAIGTVSFKPVDGGPSAMGRLEEGGAYVLRTGREPTLPPGEYVVTVGANEAPASLTGPNGGPPPPGDPITPRRYRRSETSGLRYTVERGGNTIDIDLSSDAT